MTVRAPIEIVPEIPFRGIEPFRYVDHLLFFAREPVARRLLHRVVVYRGVMLYGDSGTGKSSLVNAGLVPPALLEGYQPERLRVQPRAGEEIVVERLTANLEPLEYLPSNLVTGQEPRAVYSLADFRDRLAELHGVQPELTPLLIFDQFEELVTLFEEAPEPSQRRAGKGSQQQVVALISELLNHETRPVKLLFVFREDYLAKMSDLLCEHPEVLDRYIRLTLPGAVAVPEIVRGPFEKFPGHFARELPPSLAGRLQELMDERTGGGGVSLSELQIICLRLWNDPEPERLLERKGVQGILEEHFSEALDGMDADVRYAAVALLSRMITASGARNVVSHEDLTGHTAREDGVTSTALRAALEALEGSRLIRREVRHQVAFYEIVSEFLAPWIRAQREQLSTTDPLPALRARWQRDLERAGKLGQSPADVDRRSAVALLISLLFQARGTGDPTYNEAHELLEAMKRDESSIAVQKDVGKALEFVRALQADEPLEWTSFRGSPRLLHNQLASPALLAASAPSIGRRMIGLIFLYLAWSLLSVFAAAVALVLLDIADLGGLPSSWPVVAVVSGLVWTALYLLEAVDTIRIEKSILNAPLHPWKWGVGLFEVSSAWPLNILLTWFGGYGLAVAGHAIGVPLRLSFPLAVALTTLIGTVAYNQAVVLF